MKRVEKMAEQYAWGYSDEGFDSTVADAYEAGFRAAREMALDFVRCSLNCERGAECGACSLYVMGEEEV